MNDRTLTAYHEAGHAVVAIMLGVPFLYAHILDEAQRGIPSFNGVVGKCHLGSSPNPCISDDVKIDCAGWIAEWMAEEGLEDKTFYGDFSLSELYDRITLGCEGGGDSESIKDRVGCLFGEIPNVVCDYMVPVLELLEKNWSFVQKFASELEQKGVVCNSDLARIFAE